MLSSDLEMKEEECCEMDSRDEEWGCFHVPASHKLSVSSSLVVWGHCGPKDPSGLNL